MVHLKVSLYLVVLIHAVLLLSSPVLSDDEEDNLLQGINSYRTSLRLPPLTKHKRAACLADRVADELEDRSCTAANTPSTIQLNNYPELLSKCGIDINKTRDGVVLPACVPDLVPTLVLTNYTQSQYARYINDSRFTGVGVGKEDDWMVVVLSTNTPGGSFAGAHSLISRVAFGNSLVSLVISMLVYLVY